jgi:hypothetical protein
MQGRCRGDAGEMQGRCRGDADLRHRIMERSTTPPPRARRFCDVKFPQSRVPKGKVPAVLSQTSPRS